MRLTLILLGVLQRVFAAATDMVTVRLQNLEPTVVPATGVFYYLKENPTCARMAVFHNGRAKIRRGHLKEVVRMELLIGMRLIQPLRLEEGDGEVLQYKHGGGPDDMRVEVSCQLQ